MFSHDQILINPKGYGLMHDVCVKEIWVVSTMFADALFQKFNFLPLYQLFFPK